MSLARKYIPLNYVLLGAVSHFDMRKINDKSVSQQKSAPENEVKKYFFPNTELLLPLWLIHQMTLRFTYFHY